MKKIVLLLTGFALLTNKMQAQTETNSNFLTIKLKVKVINLITVGWGGIYKGKIEEVIDGKGIEKPDTIEFGITASKTFEFLKKGDIRIITFKNSQEINKNSYLPPKDCMVSKKNEILLITKIEKTN